MARIPQWTGNLTDRRHVTALCTINFDMIKNSGVPVFFLEWIPYTLEVTMLINFFTGWGSVTFCCRSVTLTNGSGSYYFLQWHEECKKNYFFSDFFYNLPPGTLSSVLKIYCVKDFILQALFQSVQHLYEKGKDPFPGSVPLTNWSGSRRPKNMHDTWSITNVFSRRSRTLIFFHWIFFDFLNSQQKKNSC